MTRQAFTWLSLAPVLMGAALMLGAQGASAEPRPHALQSPAGHLRRCPDSLSPKESFTRTWRAVRGSFGAQGMPPPRLAFIRRPFEEMRVDGTPAGYRRIEILGYDRLALAGFRGCREAMAARECLIHEFVHVYQAEPYVSGEIRADNVFEEVPEGLAEARAQALVEDVFGRRPRSYEAEWTVYDAYARQVRRQYPASVIRRGQFGANWGANPRLIPWAEPNPALGGTSNRRSSAL